MALTHLSRCMSSDGGLTCAQLAMMTATVPPEAQHMIMLTAIREGTLCQYPSLPPAAKNKQTTHTIQVDGVVDYMHCMCNVQGNFSKSPWAFKKNHVDHTHCGLYSETSVGAHGLLIRIK